MTVFPTRRTLLIGAAATAAASRLTALPARAAGADPFMALEASSGGRLGVAALNTVTGATVGHRADERFAFCSTFKLLAASALLRRSQTEPGLMERRIAYTKADMARYSPITSQHLGSGMTVAELCAAALQYSDNTAANLMIRLIGGPRAVTAFARSIGDRTFRLDRWETTLNTAIPGDQRDTSTPAAMLTDLRRLALGDGTAPTVLAQAGRDRLIAWMRGNTTGDKRVRAGVPAGWSVADKTGTGDYGTTNTIALAWPPGKPPLLLSLYFTQKAKDAPAREDVLADATRLVVAALA